VPAGQAAAAWDALSRAEEQAELWSAAATSALEVARRRGQGADWARVGWLRERQGDAAGASEAYATVLASEPGHLAAGTARAILLARAGEADAALDLVRAVA
jgi:hypothetical protein